MTNNLIFSFANRTIVYHLLYLSHSEKENKIVHFDFNLISTILVVRSHINAKVQGKKTLTLFAEISVTMGRGTRP